MKLPPSYTLEISGSSTRIVWIVWEISECASDCTFQSFSTCLCEMANSSVSSVQLLVHAGLQGGHPLIIRILRHLLQYSPLLPPATRQQLLAIPPSSGRGALITALNNSSIHFPLSQFPHLLSGAITFPVPVFTVWGLIEDVRVLEKFRTGEYEVHNLSVIDEAATRVIDVGGIRLRLFGLGGAVASHKMCKCRPPVNHGVMLIAYS